MHRRIAKSRKHKKIKNVDTFYSGERRQLLDKKASRANAKPSNVDDQEIPRRLAELMKTKELVKTGQFKTKRRRRPKALKDLLTAKEDDFGETQPGMKKPLKPIPKFSQGVNENEYHFISRVGRFAQEVINKTLEENKLGVDFVEQENGNVEVRKRELDEFDLEVKKMRMDVKMGNNPKLKAKINKFEAAKLQKIEKRKLKEKEKKERKRVRLEDKKDDFRHLQDDVKFGEVVDAPPTLRLKSKKLTNLNPQSRKPGKSNSLLLKKLLSTSAEARFELAATRISSASSTADRTGKRKLLPVSERRKLDEERANVIAAYRSAKKLREQQRRPQSMADQDGGD